MAYVFLNGVGINQHSDCKQRVQSKIKDLVTEEWDEPGGVLLNRKKREIINTLNITKLCLTSKKSLMNLKENGNQVVIAIGRPHTERF